MNHHIVTFLKGLWVGGTMTVPGVSGGSMAILLGVYDQLIHAVNSFWKEKINLLFLLVFAGGGGLGMLLFSRSLLSLLEWYPLPLGYFFLGAVAGGIPLIFRSARVREFSLDTVLYPALGLLLVLLLDRLPSGLFSLGTGGGILGILLQTAGGVLIAAALVLPGISVSQMLLMTGLYQGVMEHISQLELLPLIPLGTGVLLGVLLTARLMERWMNSHPKGAYLMILGFLLGSLPELFPGLPQGRELLPCAAMAAAGFLALYRMQRE